MIFPQDIERIIRDFSKPLGIKVFQKSQLIFGNTVDINILGKPILWVVKIDNRTLKTADISVTFRIRDNDRKPYIISVRKNIKQIGNFESIRVTFNKEEQLKFKNENKFIGFYIGYLLSTFDENILSV